MNGFFVSKCNWMFITVEHFLVQFWSDKNYEFGYNKVPGAINKSLDVQRDEAFVIRSFDLDEMNNSLLWKTDNWIIFFRASRVNTTRRLWSYWKQPRTVSNWWCVTPLKSWRRWKRGSRSSVPPADASSSSFSCSNSSSKTWPPSRTTCRRWGFSLL